MKAKYNDIPQDVLNEIAFILGSTEECNSNYLRPILDKYGYNNCDFLVIDPQDDKELTLEIYEKLFLSGKLAPFGKFE